MQFINNLLSSLLRAKGEASRLEAVFEDSLPMSVSTMLEQKEKEMRNMNIHFNKNKCQTADAARGAMVRETLSSWPKHRPAGP